MIKIERKLRVQFRIDEILQKDLLTLCKTRKGRSIRVLCKTGRINKTVNQYITNYKSNKDTYIKYIDLTVEEPLPLPRNKNKYLKRP